MAHPISGNPSSHICLAGENEHRDVWRLLDIEYGNPYMNMALEEAIARKVGELLVPNTIRFWRNLNSVVVGRFQSVALEVNLDACKRYKTKIVRRFTGGGAVYHDQGNLNYTICFCKEHRLFKKDSLETFSAVAQAVIEGLKILGVSAEFESPNSVQISDLKISGLAGSIKWGAVLCHGSLLVNSNLEILTEVLHVDKLDNRDVRCKYVPSARKKVTTLSAQLQRDVSIQEVKEALKTAFEDSFSITLVPGEPTKDELSLAQRLCREKYSQKRSLEISV